MHEQFNAAIKKAQSEPAQAALYHSQYGFWLGRQGDWRAAADQFAAAANLAEAAGEAPLVAEYRYAEALALQQAPRSKGKARAALRQATEAYSALGRSDRLAQTQRHLAANEARSGRFTPALNLIRHAQTACADDALACAELALDEGVYAAILGERATAAAALNRCQELATAHGKPQLAEQARALYQLLIAAPARDPLGEQIAVALRDYRASDDTLQAALLAFQVGRYGRALKLAQQSQQAALDSLDYGRYLRYSSSALLIALIQEKQGQDSAALATLLTCKKTMERHLGPETGQAIKRTLDALAVRWGPARTDKALHGYRQAMAAQG